MPSRCHELVSQAAGTFVPSPQNYPIEKRRTSVNATLCSRRRSVIVRQRFSKTEAVTAVKRQLPYLKDNYRYDRYDRFLLGGRQTFYPVYRTV